LLLCCKGKTERLAEGSVCLGRSSVKLLSGEGDGIPGEILRGKAESLTTGMALYTGQTNIKSN